MCLSPLAERLIPATLTMDLGVPGVSSYYRLKGRLIIEGLIGEPSCALQRRELCVGIKTCYDRVCRAH